MTEMENTADSELLSTFTQLVIRSGQSAFSEVCSPDSAQEIYFVEARVNS